MNIIFDERETTLFESSKNLSNNHSQHLNISKKVLPLGDILITNRENKELALIERKSVADLLASIKDGRYEEQSHRLIHASGLNRHNIIYVIEGGFSFLKPTDKRTVYSALTSLNLFKGFSIYHTVSIQETAEWILFMTDKIGKDLEKGKHFCSSFIHEDLAVVPESYSGMVQKVKQNNITPENIGEILLCQIPGISSVNAKAILKHFEGSFLKLILSIQESSESEDIFKQIVLEKEGKVRKISKVCYENIIRFLRESK
jgi:ERCC4-type nuclease